MHPCVSYAFYNKMHKKVRKMMREIASVRKMMRKIDVMRKVMRKMMSKIVFMHKMMRKMKILPSYGEYGRSEQHKTFERHLLAQNICCLSNKNTSFQNWAYQVSEKPCQMLI